MVVLQKFELVEKIKLTHDIYGLVFLWEKELIFRNGQFITFLLNWIWWRAYSILKADWKEMTLIVKKREKENGGRWGSKMICELEIWDKLNWVWPAGHFLVNEIENNKLFLWTWTGFVPLFNQINWLLNNWFNSKLMLIFWVRTNDDLFYIDELKNLKNNYSNFNFKIYLSRWDWIEFEKWYITDYLTQENLVNFQEYYICWIPSMIKTAKEILLNNWVEKDFVFTEEY